MTLSTLRNQRHRGPVVHGDQRPLKDHGKRHVNIQSKSRFGILRASEGPNGRPPPTTDPFKKQKKAEM